MEVTEDKLGELDLPTADPESGSRGGHLSFGWSPTVEGGGGKQIFGFLCVSGILKCTFRRHVT